MAFTQAEIDNIANAALDYYMNRGKVFSQDIQDKPLLRDFMSRAKTFPGGKENISVAVKGEYTTTIQGYTHDDTVSYSNPANIKRVNYPWKEIHWGIQVTFTELKHDGISVVDSATGKNTSQHSDREMTALVNLLEDKLEDMREGGERGMNEMFWQDGSQDADEVPGIKSFILDDPTTVTTVGGIDQSTNAWWRNRVNLTIPTTTPSDLEIAQTLQQEFRQLRRYAQGNPDHMLLAGSDFLDAVEKELRAKGSYTDNGWASNGGIDMSVADAQFKGKVLQYDPTLDDLGEADRLYVLDKKAIMPMVMEGENMKRHSPARPEDKYALYRAMTWTGGLVCRQRNTSGVYGLA
jgi:hypothetical protein